MLLAPVFPFTCPDQYQTLEGSRKAAAEAIEQQLFYFVQLKLHSAQHQMYMPPVSFFHHKSVT